MSLDFYKPRFGSETPEDIFCVIRTTKRKSPTLDRTIKSLKSVGITNPEIFEDLEMKGSFKPFIECLKNVILKYNGWCLLCEDDVIFCDSSIKILKNTPFLKRQTATLFCSSTQDYHLKFDGWNKPDRIDWHGSLCYFVHTDLIKEILNTKTITEWGKPDRVDSAWVESCKELKVDFLIHRPSLVQHIGDTSTLESKRKLSSDRISKNWSQFY